MRTILMSFLMIVLVAGCKSTGSKNQSSETDGSDPKITIRLANELKPDSKIWDASAYFIEEVSKESEDGQVKAGEIEVVFYDQGTIGSEKSLLENCYFDVVEMVQVNSSVVTMLDNSYNILDLPYLFVSREQHEAVLYGQIGEKLLSNLSRYGLHGLGFYGTGFRNLFYKSKNHVNGVHSPADLKGLKIRVMESPTMIAAIGAIGATAAPIPFSELFTSIKTGVVDGAENSAKIFMSYKYYEAGVNQFTMTEHFANQHVIVANQHWFDSLAPKYKKHIEESILRSQRRFDDMWAQTTEESIDQLEENGVKINYVEDKTPFIEASDVIITQFANKYPDLDSLYLEDILAMRDDTTYIDNKPKSHEILK